MIAPPHLPASNPSVQVLTGGVLKGAPLIFDLLVGTVSCLPLNGGAASVLYFMIFTCSHILRGPVRTQHQRSTCLPGTLSLPSLLTQPLPTLCAPAQVPAADPPLLQLLSLFQLSWHDVCDGGRLLRAFLQQHPGAVLQPPAGAAAGGKVVGSILLESEDGIQASFSEAGTAGEPATAQLGAGAGVPAAAPNPLAALLASLLPPQPALPATALQPAVLPPVQQPTDSSGSDDMHFGSVGAEPGATSAGASLAAASASVASNLASLASTGDSRTPRGGVRGLPARPPRGRPANRC